MWFHKVLLHICTMLKKLQQKWKVTRLDLLLILVTFAVGGSLCGFAGRKIMGFTGIEQGLAWLVVYVIIMTIIWPACVLLVSIFTGQFAFFKKYLTKVARRFSGKRESELTKNAALPAKENAGPTPNSPHGTLGPAGNIAIFASGAGSNALRLIGHFKNHSRVNIALIVCNKPGAGVISVASDAGIDVLLIEKDRFLSGDGYVDILKDHAINLIVLAGFLWKVPVTLLQHFPGAVVNIHPALLPKYGGKGMYGARVHEAVIENNETESGISIHFVDEIYDHGATIFQAFCKVEKADTPESLAAKVHQLEHLHYPRVIEDLINAKNTLNKQGLSQN